MGKRNKQKSIKKKQDKSKSNKWLIITSAVFILLCIVITTIIIKKDMAARTITVSEMLESVLTDSEDGMIYIHHGGTEELPMSDIVTGSNIICHLDTIIYDGAYLYGVENMANTYVDFATPDYMDGTPFEQAKELDIDMSDKTSAVLYAYHESEEHSDEYSEALMGLNVTSAAMYYGDIIMFYNNFYHLDVNGESYMVFDDKQNKNSKDGHAYVMIKDTDYTNDKIIVNDDSYSDKVFNSELLNSIHGSDDNSLDDDSNNESEHVHSDSCNH